MPLKMAWVFEAGGAVERTFKEFNLSMKGKYRWLDGEHIETVIQMPGGKGEVTKFKVTVAGDKLTLFDPKLGLPFDFNRVGAAATPETPKLAPTAPAIPRKKKD